LVEELFGRRVDPLPHPPADRQVAALGRVVAATSGARPAPAPRHRGPARV